VTSQFLAATPATVQGVQGGHIAGAMTLSGLSLVCAFALILASRKADRLKAIHTRDGIGAFGIFTGTVWIAAGAAWGSAEASLGTIPTSVLGPGSGLGDPGQGAIAVILTLATFAPKWKRTIWPAIFGLMAAATYGTAGGIWGVLVNIVRMVVGHFTGGA
jgi:hypothetical protein